MLQNTICFLIKNDPHGKPAEILLARKKTGFGKGKIVGIGGNLEPGETVQQACVREIEEEISVQLEETDLERVAKLTFFFPVKPEWDRVVYVFFTDRWHGTPESSREVDPFWAGVGNLPVDEMWADSGLWLAEILSGRKIVGRFSFKPDNETLAEYEIKEDKGFLWPQLKSLPYFRALLRSVEASFYQDLVFPEPVLDLGSGDGHFASTSFDFKINVGLDPWWEPLVESKQHPEAYHGLVQADGAEMPFPDGYFASGLSNSVLEHISHLDDVLAETGRVLRPGAPFVFCCPNPGYREKLSIPAALRKVGLDGLAKGYTDWFMRISRTIHADSPAVWEERLSRAGFTLERWWHYFPPESLRVLERGHYFGVPSLASKVIFGRWILAPAKWNLWLTEKLVRPYAGTDLHPDGAYTFFVARRK
ncbi:MAG: NUDIX domain-containing protein [Anaerolineales bacterium]